MRLTDKNCLASVALPAAGSTATTPAIDLRTNGAPIGQIMLGMHLKFDQATLPALVDAKTITITPKHCATVGGSYSAIPGVGNISVLGAGGVGASAFVGCPALEMEIYLPPHTLGFLKFDVTVLAAGGDNTARTFTAAGQF